MLILLYLVLMLFSQTFMLVWTSSTRNIRVEHIQTIWYFTHFSVLNLMFWLMFIHTYMLKWRDYVQSFANWSSIMLWLLKSFENFCIYLDPVSQNTQQTITLLILKESRLTVIAMLSECELIKRKQRESGTFTYSCNPCNIFATKLRK